MKRGMLGTSIAVLAVVALAWIAFAGVTRGFAAVTSDGVRRVDLERAPRRLPPIMLVDQAGQTLPLSAYGTPSSHVTFVTLQYVRCQTVCRTSAAGQSWLQHEIRARGLEQRVRLLTLSFDPANDSSEILAAHARRLGADYGSWRFATVRDAADLAALLKLFGIVVLPDGLGGYSHNAALFLIGRDGRLARAYDVERPDLALADYLRREGG
jgi:protein SCO1/2